MNDREEMKRDEGGWVELRLQGKLPERRSNHCSFIAKGNSTEEVLYIHGGRDLKEGAIETMWCVNLTKVHLLQDDPYYPVEWEMVCPNGRGPGKISHHTASVQSDEVVFYGGLKGEDSCADIFLFDVPTCTWSTLNLGASIKARDDHAMAHAPDGSFFVFGGFVNGSRVNEICHFGKQGNSLSGQVLCQEGPDGRAGHSAVCHENKVFVFGGQDDNNNKLDDMWCFDASCGSWTQNKYCEGDLKPVARSGHTAIAAGHKMFIFGGILELTKELNDLAIYDMKAGKFTCAEEDPFAGEE